MPTYKVKDPTTGVTLRLTGDSPPTEQELEQVFSQVSTKPRKTDTQMREELVLPGAQKTEQAIASRPSPWTTLRQEVETPYDFQNHPIKSTLKPLVTGLKTIAAPIQSAESALANVGMEMQAGNFNPAQLLQKAKEGVTGERPGQFGDIIRKKGGNEFGAGAVGLLATMGTSGISALAKNGTLGKHARTILSKTKGDLDAGAKLAKAAGIDFVERTVRTAKNVADPKGFAKKVRNTFFKKKGEMGKDFGDKVDELSNKNPDRSVDVSNEFQYIKDNIASTENEGLRREIISAIKGTKNQEKIQFITSLIDDPQLAKNLSLKQVQEVKNVIQSMPSIARKAKKGKFADYTAGEIELLDLVDDIKMAQSSVFPEMAEIRAPYAEYMQAYNGVRNSFKPGKLQSKLKQGFGDDEVMDMIKVVLPDETFKDINAYRKALKTIKWGGALVGGGASLGLAGEGIKRATGGH